MLKKLRLKFIALNMATVAVVLVAVFTFVVFVNYQQSVSQVTDSLDSAVSKAADRQQKPASGQGDGAAGELDAKNLGLDGALPGLGGGALGEGSASGESFSDTSASDTGASGESSFDAGSSSSDGVADDSSAACENSSGANAVEAGSSSTPSSASSDSSSGKSAHGTPPVIGGRERSSGQSMPMAVFTVSSDGTVSSIDANTASISEDVLEAATRELTSANEGSGTLSDLGLIYLKRSMGGTMYLAFADTANASGWQTLALTLAVVGIATLVVFLVISMFFSRWALRPVADAWAQQRRFVADASHDLKTPLTVILANTAIALEHPERSVASQAQWLESTQHEAESMQGLVADLLTLAKMDEEDAAAAAAGGIGGAIAPKAAVEQIDLSDLVEGELLQFESVAFERGVELSSDVALGVSVRGSVKRLRRLATTLIDNACKYVDDGGHIDVSLQVAGKNASLSVRNTGTPISPEDLPHVFDRFYRADKARTSGTGGHGLGLAIAHAIAEEHGGSLTVASTQEAGTTFTATLPLAK